MNTNDFARAASGVTGRLMTIGFLVGVMLVPMMMVRVTIEERGRYYNDAVASVSDGWAGQQALDDPVLVVPFTYEKSVQRRDENGNMETVALTEYDRHLIFPDRTDVAGDFRSETRQRGLFAVPIFDAGVKMTGAFKTPALTARDQDKAGLKYGQPFVALRIQDPRGLHGNYDFTFAGAPSVPEPGMNMDGGPGIHIPVTFDPAKPDQDLAFAFDFRLKGTRDFSYTPHARQSALTVQSNWPHPGFSGQFLPATHDVRADGFDAAWSVGALASGGAENFSITGGGKAITIGLMESANIYSRMLRAAKYGVLFLTLTYGAFFMTEVMRRFRIHPVQYLMVGAALSMFYLLLLALAEHIGFAKAYVVASASIAGLLGFYTSAVARSRMAGALFGGGIALLYAALYGILGSEDYALLLGTGLLFAVLAGAMLLTRRVDWYALGAVRRE